ncbi:MAG: hypothetical protein JW718_08290, partial [Desulfovibrionaceae bacterium]|nr:hypothetical protein [Desulfovibrionaceae bacterium]
MNRNPAAEKRTRIALAASLAVNLAVLSCLVFLVLHFDVPARLADKWFPRPPAAFELTEGRASIAASGLGPGRVMVALILGQSNAANRTPGLAKAGPGVYNFFQGRLYEAEDPLLGADGRGGTIWTRLGRLIVEHRLYDQVVLADVARGGSAVADWAPGGRCHELLLDALDQIGRSGLGLTHILWQQGESDGPKLKTRPEDYRRDFLAMLEAVRSRGVRAPVYVALATVCGSAPCPGLRAAQAGLVDPQKGILPGPDIDSLDCLLRMPDNCHLSDQGAQAAA